MASGGLPLWIEPGFLRALLDSPTAGREIGLRLLMLLCVLSVGFWLTHRRLRRSGLGVLHRDCGGMASTVALVMVTPAVLILILIFAQLVMLLDKAILVHYSAYAAARSARVWLWDFDPLDPVARVGGRFAVNPLVLAERNRDVRREVEDAARFALIPAAPVAGAGGDGKVPERVLRVLAEQGDLARRGEVLIRQASYAFDPANSNILFDRVALTTRPDMAWDLASEGDAWPVRARVEFRARLDLPVVRFFGKREDGAWYTRIKAEMVLL